MASLPTLLSSWRAAHRGFGRRLWVSAGLHATALGLLAAAGTHAVGGEPRAAREALLRVQPPAHALWSPPAAQDPTRERPLEPIDAQEPRPNDARVEPSVRSQHEPELAPAPDADRLWQQLAHARLRQPGPAAAAQLPPPSVENTPPLESSAPAPETATAEGPTRGARLIHAPPPPYPRASLRLGEEGVVSCRLHVDASGAVREVELVAGSGHTRLDRAALATLLTWRFDPALTAGSAVPVIYPHRVVFRLDGPS